jgi:hypothetical protein
LVAQWQPSGVTEIRLRPGGSLYRLSDELKKQASESQNVQNRFSGRHPKDYLTEYLGWVNEASGMLGNDLRRTELEALLHTRSYWALRQMDGSEAWLTGQIRGELQARREAFDELAAEAAELARHWQVYGIVVMPDTNVLLHATEIFDELDWPGALGIGSTTIYLVIPMVVIDELPQQSPADCQPARRAARHRSWVRSPPAPPSLSWPYACSWQRFLGGLANENIRCSVLQDARTSLIWQA